jgi:cysteine desulfurase
LSELYFDNSSTTKVCEQSAAKVLEMMTEHYGNPSSLHTMGFEAERELTAARTAVAQLLGAKTEEITFTSGGTEANNLAIFGAAHASQKRGNRIVTTAIEHPSVLNVMAQLEKEGFEVVYLKPDCEGHIASQQLFEAVNADTILVSMMAVNNEVGTILPIDAAAQAIAQAKAPALLHVDAVQAFGKLPLKPSKSKIDLMSMSGHKIHGPKGIGALYVAGNVHIVPRTFGGGQEKDLRPGTEAMPLIAGFGAAVKALPNLTEETKAVAQINGYCREQLGKLDGVVINSPVDALPYILNFSTCSVRSETMLHFLASKQIFVSSGSACSKAKPSHVLTAMELSRDRINSSLRISFSRYNTLEEAQQFIAALQQGLNEITKRPL